LQYLGRWLIFEKQTGFSRSRLDEYCYGISVILVLEGGSMFEKVYRRNPDIVYREIAGEYILVPIHHKAGEADSIYVLNETGTRIWELVDGKRTLADIIALITAEFDVDEKTLADDLLEYVGEMVTSGTLQEV
jgi:hypothetical protein